MSRTPRNSRRLITALVATAMAVGLAACGGDGDEADDVDVTTTESVETTTTVAEETTTTTSVAETTTTVPATDTIIDVLAESGQFTTLLDLIDRAGLADELTIRNVTLLAPTDEAFAAVDPELLGPALDDVDALREILLNHVIPTPQTVAQISIFNNVLTAGGGDYTVAVVDGSLFIGDALVVDPDIEASNGIIQGINAVLLKAT